MARRALWRGGGGYLQAIKEKRAMQKKIGKMEGNMIETCKPITAAVAAVGTSPL